VSAPNAEFPALVAEAVQAERAAAMEDLGRDATLWLAAVPLWTRGAAEAARFPAPSVIEFVKRARDVGWCETRGSLRGQRAANLRFWMPNAVRRDVVDLLSRLEGAEPLVREATKIAELITSLGRATGTGDERDEIALPGTLLGWAGLMMAEAPDLALVDRVRQAVQARDLSGAQHLVAAGDALAALLAGTAELAADRARRLLNLGTRQRQDGRALEYYLDRPELSGAVTRLLQPGDANWALHLRGAGGSGKTMLIRYLASGRYAAERGMAAIPIARADFDHMSPDYPVRRPVQLLLELADELALHTAAVGRADRALRRFRASAAGLHESLSSVREERPSPMQIPQVLGAIDDFAAMLAELPEVLLILDTCEELAKADSGDPAAPAVATTLAIMERISVGASSVRVLFAGRRPLPRRDYLEVREVTGFTIDEARRYLAAFSSRPLADDLVDAMICQSPAVDLAVPPPGELPSRVSPFDLALYRSWAEQDPGFDTGSVAQGTDAYIEWLIIERLRDPHVLRALPVLACAGRCRIATIASFVGTDAAVVGPRLAEQEWIDADGDPPMHITAKPALAARLRHYFSAPDREAEFTAETARLADALRCQVADAALGDIDVDELLAALRLSEPADAVRLWDNIADRVVTEGRWSWLLNVTRRVRGESEEGHWPTADALRATVLASSIAASRRAFPSYNVRAAWNEVFVWSASHPEAEAGQFLRARAALGSLPHSPDDESLWSALRAGYSYPYGSRARATELTAATVDTVHQLLETCADEAAARLFDLGSLDVLYPGRPDDSPSSAPALAAGGNAQIRAWTHVVVARFHADETPTLARDALTRAEYEAIRATTESASEPVWTDWIPPDDLLARVRIERGLIESPGDRDLETWQAYAADNLGTIDGERLASVCLRLRLGQEVIDPSVIERWEAADRYDPGRMATCSAHELVPPLFATLAEAWLAAGDPQRALNLLERRRTLALDSRDDDATVRVADEETVRIARRLRLDYQRALLSRLSIARDSDPSRLHIVDSARRAMAVVYGVPPHIAGREVSERPAGWHTWCQCRSNPRVPLPPVKWPTDSTSTEHAADIELDLQELRQLDHPKLSGLEEQLAGWLAQPRPAPRVRSADPYPGVRTALRRAALTTVKEDYQLPGEVPRRLLAEMAFDEAELLAPRLPVAASRLFEYAYDAYLAAGDPIGQVLAISSITASAVADQVPLSVERMGEAFARLRADRPDVAAALTGDPADAGPWRYWADFVRRLKTLEYAQVARGPLSWVGPVLDKTSHAISIAFLAAGLVAAGLYAFHAAPRYFIFGALSLIVVVVGVVAVTGAWRLRSVRRLADSQGVGVFTPATVGLTALIQFGVQRDRARVYLSANARPLRTTRRRYWARLIVLAFAGALLSGFHRGGRQIGYTGGFQVPEPSAQAVRLDWETGCPDATSEWWSTGTAAGIILVKLADGTQPWERIITEALGPHAAGRIDWYRRLIGGTRLPDAHGSAAVALDAPAEWLRYFGRFYKAGEVPYAEREEAESPVRVRYAIGRAVSTSAGPRLDVSGERTESSSARELLGTEALSRGAPSLIVLQAEPTSEDVEAGPRDDLLEKLALAVDLLEAGAAREVLIVPALPVRLAEAVARTVAEHAATRPRSRARALQASLRRLLRPEVEPAVLDDLVLFS